MSAAADLRFFIARKPVPKGSVDGFPIARDTCKECAPARSCAAACGACDACKPAVRCGQRNCFGGKIVGVSIVDGGGKALEAWESFVTMHATAARKGVSWPVVAKPAGIEIWMVFLLERPEGHFTGKGALSAEGLRHPVPAGRPDWDKLARAACDAFTGSLVEDDSQIVASHVSKSYTAGRGGLLVRVRRVSRDPDWVLEELRAAGLPTPVVQGALL